MPTIKQRQQEGKSLCRQAVRRDGHGMLQGAERYFGSWRKALLAAGVVVEGRGK